MTNNNDKVLNKCRLCDWTWFSRKSTSRVCPQCYSSLWNRERKVRTINTTKGPLRNQVITERKEKPCATLQTIANKFSISRERVRQILKSGNMPTKHSQLKYICNNCGKQFTPLKSNRKKLFCGSDCLRAYNHQRYWVVVACSVCGQEKEVRLSDFKTRALNDHGELYFCSRHCQGRWLAKHHDSITYKRKFDHDLIWEKHLETGFGAVRLSRLLNISVGITDHVLRKKKKQYN
jgi:hypothetical protein